LERRVDQLIVKITLTPHQVALDLQLHREVSLEGFSVRADILQDVDWVYQNLNLLLGPQVNTIVSRSPVGVKFPACQVDVKHTILHWRDQQLVEYDYIGLIWLEWHVIQWIQNAEENFTFDFANDLLRHELQSALVQFIYLQWFMNDLLNCQLVWSEHQAPIVPVVTVVFEVLYAVINILRKVYHSRQAIVFLNDVNEQVFVDHDLVWLIFYLYLHKVGEQFEHALNAHHRDEFLYLSHYVHDTLYLGVLNLGFI